LRGDSQALATLRSFVIRHVWKNFFRHGYRKYEFPHDQGQNLIVEAHGGKMWVESDEGKGTTFFFSLPIETRETSAT